jgi:hypothetical protein
MLFRGRLVMAHVEGRGPAIELLLLEMKAIGAVDGEAARTAGEAVRDGRFRRDQWGREWAAEFPEELGTVFGNPKLWLSADVEDEREWTLVVERSDWPDFGWHLEFHGVEFRELWAGD